MPLYALPQRGNDPLVPQGAGSPNYACLAGAVSVALVVAGRECLSASIIDARPCFPLHPLRRA